MEIGLVWCVRANVEIINVTYCLAKKGKKVN